MSKPARILIVEDDEAHADALRMALETDGHRVQISRGVDPALDSLRARRFDLVLTDLMLGEQRDGLDLMREARLLEPDLSFFLITGFGNVEIAVRAMREGASDYLTKPVNIVELRTRVQREVEKRQLSRDNQELRAELERRSGMDDMIGSSAVMQKVFSQIRQVGPTTASVLVLGESGTGKELVARALHRQSTRSDKRFVAINCAALNQSLIESELFGHRKGAFTGADSDKAGKFEYAHGGTLFLDEIGEMPMATQAKLLRVLEDRSVIPVGDNQEIPVDVRIISATNSDLDAQLKAGKFRQDLFFRLNVVELVLPPLRERRADIPLLIEHFRRQLTEHHQRDVGRVDETAVNALTANDWPGNIRELRNVIESMVIMDTDGVISADDLPSGLTHLLDSDADSPELTSTLDGNAQADSGFQLAGRSLNEVEKELISVTLDLVKGNRASAARTLGIGERTLYRKIKEYGLN